MTSTTWSATSAPSGGAPGPSRLRRWGVRAAVAALLLAVVAWGGFTWLFYNPFEGEVERLDRCIPASSTVALRGSAEELLGAAFVRDRVLRRDDVLLWLETEGVDGALRDLEEEQERLNGRLPGFLAGLDARADLLGRETVVFGHPRVEDLRTSSLAVATRVAPRARRILSLLKHDWVRRRIEEDSGLRITRYPLVCEIDAASFRPQPGWEVLYEALVRDVLIVGNDRDLVTEAAHLAATGGGGSLPDRPDAVAAFADDGAAPLRAFVDLSGVAALAAEAAEPTPGERIRSLPGVAGMLGPLLDPDNLATVRARLSFPSPDAARADLAGVRGPAALSSLAADLADGPLRPAAESLQEAAVLAPAGSAVLAVRLEVRPGALLQVLEARAEPGVRKEIERALREGGSGLEEVAVELDDYLDRGVSVVVERLPECDGIALDTFGADEEGKFILPLPGVLVALRQNARVGQGGAEKMFRRRLEEWRENLSVLEELEGLPAGMTGLRFRPKFLTAEQELLRPAVAFEGDLVLLTTNEGTLRRALEARDGRRAALSDFPGFAEACAEAGEGQCAVFLEAGAGWLMARDQRREEASFRVEKDWVLERRRIHSAVAIDFMRQKKEIRQQEIVEEVDRLVAEAEREQREVEFPEAVREYLREIEAWKELRSVAGALSWDASGLRLSGVLRTPERP